MTVGNTIYYESLDFEKYLQIDGTSFSTIKGFDGVPSAGMRLGTRVHNYISEPEKYDWQQAEEVRAIASAIKKTVAAALKFMKKELSFTSDFSFNGMTMRYKGRADGIIPGMLCIDYKVLSGDIEAACDRFGYENQVSGYCLATGCPKGIIVAYNRKIKEVQTKVITPSQEFWNYNIVRYGRPTFY